jgi:hypothetical protein
MWAGSVSSRIKAVLQIVCCRLLVKVSRGIIQRPPTGLEPMPRTSVALTAQTQYLNVR